MNESQTVQSTSAVSRQPGDAKAILHVVFTDDELPSPFMGDLLARLQCLQHSDFHIRVEVYSESPARRDDEVVRLLTDMRERQPSPFLASLSRVGQWSELSSDHERLFELGGRIKVCHGAATGMIDPLGEEELKRGLAELSEFGFRCVVNWYVDQECGAGFLDCADELLDLTYYSGFSLPLAISHPQTSPDRLRDSLPDADQYAALLVEAYQKYSFYDEVFEPLAELCRYTMHSAFVPYGNFVRSARLLVREGQIFSYKLCPSLGRMVGNVDDIMKQISTDEGLRQFSLDVFRGDSPFHTSNAVCNACDLLRQCGGVDCPESGLDHEIHEVMCESRMLFLKHFRSLQTPDRALPVL